MLKAIVAAIAAAALAVKAWASARLWKVEKERKDADRADAAAQDAATLGHEVSRALAEGRVTDAAALRRRWDAARRSGALLAAFAILAAVALPAGCVARRTADSATAAPEVIVLRERVWPVAEGETLTVPMLLPPARQWYLVDDVGLSQWLGLDIDYSTPAKEKK